MSNVIEFLKKKTAEANAEFEAADNAGKRVIIAKDVIAALTAEAIKPTQGQYFFLPAVDRYDQHEIRRLIGDRIDTSLQDILPTLPPCHVCAKGALFVCTVARRNQVIADQAFGPGAFDAPHLSAMLGGVFGPEQLALIEAEFDGDMIDAQNDEQKRYQPVMFNEGDEDSEDRTPPRDRMIAIMQNIVDNGGTFIPA